MSADIFTLKEIAKRLTVPQRVVTQWEEAYPEWVGSAQEEGERCYGRDALIAMERIKNLLYRCGYTQEEVQATLHKSDLPRRNLSLTLTLPESVPSSGAAAAETPASGTEQEHESRPAESPAPAVGEPSPAASVYASRYATSPYSSVSALVQQNTPTVIPHTPAFVRAEPLPRRQEDAPAAVTAPSPAPSSATRGYPPLKAAAPLASEGESPAAAPEIKKQTVPPHPSPAITEFRAAAKAAAAEAAAIRKGLLRLLGAVA